MEITDVWRACKFFVCDLWIPLASIFWYIHSDLFLPPPFPIIPWLIIYIIFVKMTGNTIEVKIIKRIFIASNEYLCYYTDSFPCEHISVCILIFATKGYKKLLQQVKVSWHNNLLIFFDTSLLWEDIFSTHFKKGAILRVVSVLGAWGSTTSRHVIIMKHT